LPAIHSNCATLKLQDKGTVVLFTVSHERPGNFATREAAKDDMSGGWVIKARDFSVDTFVILCYSAYGRPSSPPPQR
jgi:hypothetical protein